MEPLVLIVDDDSDSREMYAEYLRASLGVRTMTAADGGQALGILETARPVVIVLDLEMPGIDGFEVARRVKADPRTRAVRIIALTGFALDTDAEAARLAGCDDVCVKPCVPTVLSDFVAGCLHAARR